MLGEKRVLHWENRPLGVHRYTTLFVSLLLNGPLERLTTKTVASNLEMGTRKKFSVFLKPKQNYVFTLKTEMPYLFIYVQISILTFKSLIILRNSDI